MTSPDDYAALRESAAIGAIAPRGQIAVAGADRLTFLHGLLTNDIASLAAGRGCYAAWLTPQGRMLCDLHVLESGDMVLLDVPAAETEAIAARLEQFHFSEDVQISTLTSLAAIWLHGPAAGRLVGDGFDGWMQYQNARVEIGGVPVAIARIDQLAVPGFVIYADNEREGEVTAALRAAGALHATPASLEAARLETRVSNSLIRQLTTAWPTPHGPKIDQHVLTAKLGKLSFLAVKVGESEVRQLLANDQLNAFVI